MKGTRSPRVEETAAVSRCQRAAGGAESSCQLREKNALYRETPAVSRCQRAAGGAGSGCQLHGCVFVREGFGGSCQLPPCIELSDGAS